jgi:hypothetical protein
MKALFDGNIVPAEDLLRVQPVNRRQRIQFVQHRHDSMVFNVRQPADVQNEVGTPTPGGQFEAGPLHISIR